MKNLKKVLALVLVVAMMASFAVSASAFTDADKIEYNTAVEVLTGLGVISGYSDDTFRPTDAVTRGAFAKMVAYVMNGGVNASSAYGTYAAGAFSDVSATSTFGPSIGYCTKEGIISGYANGTFRASNKVTGLAAAKMLLGALGYKSEIEGYTGEKWTLNVLADADDAGLLVGMKSVDLTKNLTREQAAQMIWNALQATMVGYAQTGTSISINGAVVSTGASEATAKVQGSYTDIFGNSTLELAEKCFDGFEISTTTTDDAFKRPVVAYEYNSDVIAVEAATPVATYTAATTYGTLYTKFGAGFASATLTQYLNGTTSTVITAADATSGNKDTFGANGQLVEIYKTGKATYTVVAVDTYVGTITAHTDAKKNADGEITVKESVTVSYNSTTGSFNTTAFTDADVAANTVVLVTATSAGVQSVVAAEKVTGTVSKIVADTSITAGGTTYAYSNKHTAASSPAEVKKDADIYLDSYGYAIQTGIAVGEKAADVYAFVLDAQSGSVFAGANKAQLLFTDGTTAIVDTATDVTTLKNHIVSYTVKNDVYTLTDKDKLETGKSVTVARGKTTISLASDSTITNASTATVFVVKTQVAGKDVYTAYTGYAAVPSISGTSVSYAVVASKNPAVAAFVYIDGTTATTVTGSNTTAGMTYVYVDTTNVKTTTDENGTYYTFNAVSGGNVTTVNLASALFESSATLDGKSGLVILKSTTVTDGIVIACAEASSSSDYTKVTSGTKKAIDGLVGIGSDYLVYADNCTVTVVEDGVFTASTIAAIGDDADDEVYYTKNPTTDAITSIVIVKK